MSSQISRSRYGTEREIKVKSGNISYLMSEKNNAQTPQEIPWDSWMVQPGSGMQPPTPYAPTKL